MTISLCTATKSSPWLVQTKESPCTAAKTQSRPFIFNLKKHLRDKRLYTLTPLKNFFIIIMLYIASPGLISLITRCFCLLNIVTYSTPYTPNLFSVSMSLSLSICLNSTYKGDYTVICLSLSRSVCAVTNGKISFFFFNSWVIVHYIYTTSLSIHLFVGL